MNAQRPGYRAPLTLLGITAAAALATYACGSGAAGGAARATAQTTDPAHRADDHGLRGPFLWEVQGQRGPSYLFGTIHAGFRADKELPAWVWDKLAACDTFVMEADVSKVEPLALTQRATLQGKTLDELLGPKDFESLVELTEMSPTSLRPLAPWFVISLLMQRLHPTPVPLDEALRQRAARSGKELAFLEDWKFQLDVLAKAITVDDVREMLDPDSKGRRLLTEMLTAYRAGDLEKMAALTLDPVEIAKDPERHAVLFDRRNRDWVPKLAVHLRRGRTFVAVGAGHFVGEQGLIELLRAEGYVLTRVVKP